MTDMTNAQAALQASATAFQGRMKAVIAEEVVNLAHHYKKWLDAQDKADLEARLKAKDNALQQHFPGMAAAIQPRGLHHLRENHNGDPICNCGWDPAGITTSREDARNEVRIHISMTKGPDGG